MRGRRRMVRAVNVRRLSAEFVRELTVDLAYSTRHTVLFDWERGRLTIEGGCEHGGGGGGGAVLLLVLYHLEEGRREPVVRRHRRAEIGWETG